MAWKRKRHLHVVLMPARYNACMALWMCMLQAGNADAPPAEAEQVEAAPAQEESAAGEADPAATPEAEEGAADAEAGQTEEKPAVKDAAETYATAAHNLRESVGLEDEEYSQGYWVGPAIALGVMLLAIFVRFGLKRLLDGYLKQVVERTATTYDDKLLAALHRSVSWFVLIGAVFIAFAFLDLPEQPVDWDSWVWRILHTFLLVAIGVLLYRIVEITLYFLAEQRKGGDKSVLDEQFVPLLRDIAKFAIIILAIVMIVQSWGYSAASILAGVGIGGLALAFAAQDTVANIFGSFVVYSDRPYKVGDWILMDSVEGTVEEIGIRSTRIRKFDKTVVSVPNKVVANTHIQNFSQMPIRRIKLFVGVTYDTPPDKIEAAVEMIRGLLAESNDIYQGFWMVNFTEMGDWSLNILVYAFTETTVWKEYMEIRQRLLLNILSGLGEMGVDVAFPSQTVYYRDADPDGGMAGSGLPGEFTRPAGSGRPPALKRGKTGQGRGSSDRDVVTRRGELDD